MMIFEDWVIIGLDNGLVHSRNHSKPKMTYYQKYT